MKQLMHKKSSGFTLIEMITVIVILGVLASAITTFITFSTQIYAEATARDKLVSSARFAIERLNREVRNALPNSLMVSGKCLKFTPIVESTVYTNIPVAPEPANDKITVISFEKDFDPNWRVIVYPLESSDVNVGSGKVYAVANMAPSGDTRDISLDVSNPILFNEHSPTQRLYFINGTIEYCITDNKLFRKDSLTNNTVLMAENLSDTASSFEVQNATLRRNAMVQIDFQFEKNNEIITFNNEIQVLNVP